MTRVIETRRVDHCHKAFVIIIEVGKFLDLIGLGLMSMTDDDVLVTSESVDELKVMLSSGILNGFQLLVNTHC